MKRILVFLLVSIMLTACGLEVEPTDKYSDAVAWKDEQYIDMYVKGLYGVLRDNAEIYSTQLSDGLSDILKYSVNNLNENTFQNKTLLQENYITPSNGVLSVWGNYDGIKRENEFLYNVDKNTAGIDPEFIEVRKAEVRFLRAFLYYKLIRNHGGIILRLHNSGVDGLDSEKDANKARASEEESWDFVIAELQEIAPVLAKHSWSADDFGRITAGTVYALLTRCALYAKKYEVVIAAGQEVEKLGYSLEANYNDVFTNLTSKEIILPVMFKAPTYTHFFDRYFGPTGDVASRGGWACPTEDLVEHYQIKENGNYVDFNWNNPDHKLNPYQDREPRFYASILYNGASWNGRTIETFVGGKDGFTDYDPNSNTPANVTGYFMRKFLQMGNPDVDKGSDSYWIELRYAEVLLNMAEAYAQSGNFSKGYEYLNKVRTRGGHLAARTTGSNLVAFMSDLEAERMLELAFEGHRYWDLRRWRRAVNVIDGKRAHGLKIIKEEDGGFSYNKVTIENSNRYFPEKYYYIPIPQSEIINNSLVKQTLQW